MTTYFCDGLKEVSVVNGVARLEFHRLEAVQRGGNRELVPVAEFTVALPCRALCRPSASSKMFASVSPSKASSRRLARPTAMLQPRRNRRTFPDFR